MSPDENLLCSPEEKVRLEIANQADVIEFLADFVAKGRTRMIAPVFAGESLPSKLKARKSEYLDGLQAADKGDLSKLEQLVLECFESQFSDLARKPIRSK